jgi:hypothetical protein
MTFSYMNENYQMYLEAMQQILNKSDIKCCCFVQCVNVFLKMMFYGFAHSDIK